MTMAKRRKKAPAITGVRRRKRTSLNSAPIRRRRKKSTGLGAGLMAPLKNTFNAGVGGVIYGIGTPMLSASPLMRALYGLAGSFLLGYFNFPTMGSGMAGASASELVKGSLGLNDSDLEETEYTDVDLSGQELVTDSQGNVFALGDNETVEPLYLGNMNDGSFDLSANGFDLSDYSGDQSVMMVPSYTS